VAGAWRGHLVIGAKTVDPGVNLLFTHGPTGGRRRARLGNQFSLTDATALFRHGIL